tara:strand:- start:2310 stop:2696 length:387 start_codon:yes stop_codon:yes gene_type:complete
MKHRDCEINHKQRDLILIFVISLFFFLFVISILSNKNPIEVYVPETEVQVPIVNLNIPENEDLKTMKSAFDNIIMVQRDQEEEIRELRALILEIKYNQRDFCEGILEKIYTQGSWLPGEHCLEIVEGK